MPKITYNMLNDEFLYLQIPELKKKIMSESQYLGCNLPHSLYGNILNPVVVSLIKKDEYKNNKLLEKIFNLYEQMAEYGDADVKNLLQVTLLEYLWDDYTVYTRSLEIMEKYTLEINKVSIHRAFCP